MLDVSVEHVVPTPAQSTAALPVGSQMRLPVHWSAPLHPATQCCPPPQDSCVMQHTLPVPHPVGTGHSSCVAHPQLHDAQPNTGGVAAGSTQHSSPCWPAVPSQTIEPHFVGGDVQETASPTTAPSPGAGIPSEVEASPVPPLLLLPVPLLLPLPLPLLPLELPLPPSLPLVLNADPPHAATTTSTAPLRVTRGIRRIAHCTAPPREAPRTLAGRNRVSSWP